METIFCDNPLSVPQSCDINIDLSLPRETRIRSYIQQIKDPYSFQYKGVVVNIAYSQNSGSIEDRLEEYIRWRQRQHCSCHDEDKHEEVTNKC